ncbi:SdrD B-like domain-containing protein [Aquihabitans daechungensis]|uniref:SdrD B-like domain-containing protein n=1 Tax=Aquihabitans daechungensis TaxID=1052257 RepID=UPI003BA2AC59
MVNLTAPNAPPFATATVQYARSAGWGPNAGPTGTQWWNMSRSGCAATDVVGGVFYTSNQVDWSNGNGNLINARDINVVRYLPNGPYLGPNQRATYSINVHFQVADNNPGDAIVDYSSFDPDGPNGPTAWETSSCNGGGAGTCPDPPELALNNANYRPGPVSSGVMIHIDSHPTIVKNVLDPPSASGTTPIDFRYELRLGNTQTANSAPRQAFTISDVLPPGFVYQSGSSAVVSNPAGLTIGQPSVSTVGNVQTLTWTVQGLTLDEPSANMPVIEYVARAGVFVPSSGTSGYINRATISGPGILGALAASWSPNSSITAAQFLGLSDIGIDGLNHSRWRLFDEARVIVTGQNRVIMTKSVDTGTSEPGDTFRYSLTYGNTGADVERMDAYDLLPFDGDGRGTSTHGALELLSVTEDQNSDVDVWISSTAPAALDALDNGSSSPMPGGINPTASGLPGLGSPAWPCMIQNAGQTGCPALSDVTAIRIVGNDPNPGASGPGDSFLPRGPGGFTVEVAVRSVGGRGGDEFVNDWSAEYAPIGTPSIATAPAHVLAEGAIGDRVFRDRNRNGTFDTGDQGIAGVEVNVFNASGAVVGTDHTDADGRWLVDHLRPGDYRIRIPSTAFDVGAPLQGLHAAPGGVADPDVDADEAVDHDAHDLVSGIEAGDLVTLGYGSEPLLDDIGSLTFLRDVDSNLTVDFGVVPVDSTSSTVPTTSTVPAPPPNRPAGPPAGPRTPPRRPLPRTGWESLLWILIGGSLVVGGAMVISRRQDLRA